MSSALKQTLHALVDTLPERELPAARRYLEFLRDEGSDPYAHLDDEDGLDEQDRERLHASIRRGVEQMHAGEGRPAAEVIADLRARG